VCTNRRQEQAAAAGGDEMESVKSYFNGTGFERWNKIYGETDDVNKVHAPATSSAPQPPCHRGRNCLSSATGSLADEVNTSLRSSAG
jgi:hypothetical protein